MLKKCKVCRSTVDAANECPICHTSLTYEPFCTDDKEHFAMSRYYVIYVAKQIWFSVLCCIFVAVMTALPGPHINEPLTAAIIFAAISLLISVLRRRLVSFIMSFSWNTWFHTDDYFHVHYNVIKYLFGGMSVVFAIVGKSVF